MLNRFSLAYISCVWIALLLTMAACAPQEQSIVAPSADAVVARYDGQEILVRDFMLEFQETQDFNTFLAYTKVDPDKPLPGGGNLNSATDIIEGVIEVLAFDKTLASKAREAGLHESQRFLAAMETVTNEELYQHVIVEDVLKEIRFTANDFRHYYDENREGLFREDNTNVYKIRGLYVRTEPERSQEEAFQRIQQAYQELQSGVPFESVALVYSDAPPRLRGKLNALPPEIIADPVIEEQLSKLNPGEYSEVFLTQERFNVYLLEEFIEGEYKPYESVKDEIIQQLFLRERNQKIFYLTEILKQKHNCIINAELLSRSTPAPDELLVLSIPGVYELSLGEFRDQAHDNRHFTLEEREAFLNELANKAVCLAEAEERGWSTEEVQASLSVWERKQLRDTYIQHLSEPHYFPQEQIEAWYEENQTNRDLLLPAKYDLMYHFFPMEYQINVSSIERSIRLRRSEALANRFIEIIGEGHPFEEAAILIESESGTPIRGGALGSLSALEMNAQLSTAVRNLKVGEISEPRQVFDLDENRYGFEVYYLRSMEPPIFMDRDEALSFIRTRSNSGIYNTFFKQEQDAFFPNTTFTYDSAIKKDVITYLTNLAQRPDWQVDITRYATR